MKLEKNQVQSEKAGMNVQRHGRRRGGKRARGGCYTRTQQAQVSGRAGSQEEGRTSGHRSLYVQVGRLHLGLFTDVHGWVPAPPLTRPAHAETCRRPGGRATAAAPAPRRAAAPRCSAGEQAGVGRRGKRVLIVHQQIISAGPFGCWQAQHAAAPPHMAP